MKKDDFGNILRSWEKQKKETPLKKTKKVHDVMEDWLNKNPVVEKESKEGSAVPVPGEERTRLRSMDPEAELDLHGFKVGEAITRLNTFIVTSSQRGLRKVLVIYGKGNHSKNGPVLRKAVHEYLERCPYSGETGIPSSVSGGAGALWIILRKNNYLSR
jgi:DNA-nicking Smr family endonuclease